MRIARAPGLFLALSLLGLTACRSGQRQSLPPPAPRPTTAALTQTATAAEASATLLPRSTAFVQPATEPTRAPTTAADRPAPTAVRPHPGVLPPAEALGLGQGAKGGRLGAVYRLKDLRQGEHPGFTRLVWELAADPPQKDGADVPLWEIVEEANQAEPKAAALLEGCCHIRLRLADTYAQDFVGALSLSPAPSGPVRGTRLLPMEDDSSLTFAIDLAEAAPYTVTVLQDPLRVVVDVYRP